MFKTIIVGVDFSDYSKVVVKQAQLLSQLWDAELVLVHAVHQPVEYTPYMYMAFPNVLTPEDYQKRIKKTYNFKGSLKSIVVKIAPPSAVIQDVAEHSEEPLIVAGHTSQSRFEDFFFGSTAQALALTSKVPVWIHRGTKVVKPRKVLIPHDLSKKANAALDIVQELSLKTPISYEAFYVKEKPFPVLEYKSNFLFERKLLDQIQDKIQNILKDYPKISFKTSKGHITSQLVKRTKKFDLLVMARHNPTGLFSKSETISLLTKVKTPIMIIP